MKINTQFRWAFDAAKVIKQIERQNRRALFRMAGLLRRDIIRSIKRSPRPGPPGGPIRTRGAGRARRSILFAVEGSDQAVIGPTFSQVGLSMAAHEFGATYKNHNYDRRPTVGPALDRNLPRLADEFVGSLA